MTRPNKPATDTIPATITTPATTTTTTRTETHVSNEPELGETEINKAVTRRYYEEFINERRLDVLEEIVAEDAIDETRAYSGGSGDRDDFRQHALWLWESVRDVKTTVTDLVAEGDRVVAYWRIEGIHHGTIFGVPGTGKPFTGTSISTITFRDGKVVRYTVLPDRLGIIKQLSDEPV